MLELILTYCVYRLIPIFFIFSVIYWLFTPFFIYCLALTPCVSSHHRSDELRMGFWSSKLRVKVYLEKMLPFPLLIPQGSRLHWVKAESLDASSRLPMLDRRNFYFMAVCAKILLIFYFVVILFLWLWHKLFFYVFQARYAKFLTLFLLWVILPISRLLRFIFIYLQRSFKDKELQVSGKRKEDLNLIQQILMKKGGVCFRDFFILSLY